MENNFVYAYDALRSSWSTSVFFFLKDYSFLVYLKRLFIYSRYESFYLVLLTSVKYMQNMNETYHISVQPNKCTLLTILTSEKSINVITA